ncbi:MAG: DUF1761 domain-containing protein [Specibacter sp.]
MSTTTVSTPTTGKHLRFPRPGWARWALLAAAAVAPLVTASIWYSIFGGAWVQLSGVDPNMALHPSAGAMLGQVGRNAVVAAALTVLVRRTRASSLWDVLVLACLVWFGFHAMSVLGSVLHEGYPFALYLIHSGDALQTTLVMAMLIWLAQRPRHHRGGRTMQEGTAGQ